MADLERLDSALARRLELVVVAEDFAWSCLFSHETGSLVHEELYELGSRHPRTGEP